MQGPSKNIHELFVTSNTRTIIMLGLTNIFSTRKYGTLTRHVMK